jgi:hypothetical protein
VQISLIAWLPLVVSILGTAYYVAFTEASKGLKALALVLTLAGIVLQFGYMFKVPFIVPLLLQSTVAIWMAIYWKLDQGP